MGSVWYFVGVHTATGVKGGGEGTGNTVSISINGSEPAKLSNSKNNFEEDDYDAFAVCVTPTISGDISEITLSLGKGLGTKWCCDYVIVSSYGKTSKFFKVPDGQYIEPGKSLTLTNAEKT